MISDTSTAERRGGCSSLSLSLACHTPPAGKEGERVSRSTGATMTDPLEAVSGLRPSHRADAMVTSRPDREAVDLKQNIQGVNKWVPLGVFQ
jgi:hypothetical protein